MWAADARAPQRRVRAEAGAADALALGIAQACALVPGVSRNGATLTAARARGFRRADANALSRHVALPVIVGATLLKGVRLARRGLPAGVAGAFAAGIAAAFASTLASVRIIRAVERDRSLAPYAAYRLALAAVVVGRALREGAPERLEESGR
jgi:undecaprenyl-diphosphatase